MTMLDYLRHMNPTFVRAVRRKCEAAMRPHAMDGAIPDGDTVAADMSREKPWGRFGECFVCGNQRGVYWHGDCDRPPVYLCAACVAWLELLPGRKRRKAKTCPACYARAVADDWNMTKKERWQRMARDLERAQRGVSPDYERV